MFDSLSNIIAIYKIENIYTSYLFEKVLHQDLVTNSLNSTNMGWTSPTPWPNWRPTEMEQLTGINEHEEVPSFTKIEGLGGGVHPKCPFF